MVASAGAGGGVCWSRGLGMVRRALVRTSIAIASCSAQSKSTEEELTLSVDLAGDGRPVEEGAREDPDELDALLLVIMAEPNVDMIVVFLLAEARFFFSFPELRLFWNQTYVDSGLLRNCQMVSLT